MQRSGGAVICVCHGECGCCRVESGGWWSCAACVPVEACACEGGWKRSSVAACSAVPVARCASGHHLLSIFSLVGGVCVQYLLHTHTRLERSHVHNTAPCHCALLLRLCFLRLRFWTLLVFWPLASSHSYTAGFCEGTKATSRGGGGSHGGH